MSLAPGVLTVKQAFVTGGAGGISSGFYGPSDTYSVAGSRPVGQVFLLDNQDLQGYWQKGAGASITGNSLGVDAIQEFQLLTNTYSAQFGGTGAAMNAASKSGTNDFHGSAFEFLRNSALDARNFFDGTKIPPFRRNQFGGTVGGPVKKDKAFFFLNYEGLRSALGITGNQFVPDALSRTGMVPCNTVAGKTPATCANGQRVSVPVSANIGTYLNIYPTPLPGATEQIVAAGPFTGYPSGNALFPIIANQPTSENYILGRMDYTLGSKDSLFGRYISDTAYLLLPAPFSNLANWPAAFHGGDQFFTVEEKHIVTATSINEVRFSFSRTNERSDQNFLSNPATDPLQFYLGAPDYNPGDREDGNLIVGGGTSNVGPGPTARWHLIQNKFIGGDDFFWSHGAHSLKIGASVSRVQNNIAVGREGGIFVFGSLPGFLAATPVQFQGEVNPHPGFTRTRYSREIQVFPYIQDDWKVRSNLTVNIGLRYDFETNPVCVTEPCNAILNPLSSPVFTQVHHVLGSNPDTLNFDPRIGLAWDPFSDHKTSVRAGFGMFHEPIAARTYLNAYSQNPPVPDRGPCRASRGYTLPASGSVRTSGFGMPESAFRHGLWTRLQIGFSAPYEMQYNLTVQREVGHGMVASLGYVGAQGVHLYAPRNLNTPTVVDALGNPVSTTCTSPSCFFKGPVPNPAFAGLDDAAPTSHSTYNGLVASLTRQISRNLQGQVSYTYSSCIDNGSASSGLEQASAEILDAYNQRFDRGPCLFNVTHALRVNAVYNLPFTGNRLVSGWQLSEILSATTGYPVNITNGLLPQVANTGGITADRPNYSGAAGCHPSQITDTVNALQRTVQWFNPACYAVQPFATLGNVGRDSLIGPGLLNLDFSIIKQTRITEKLNTEFRAEFFNIINHTNLGQPNGAVFSGAGGAGAAIASFIAGNAGLITNTSTTSRQIQFALKLIF